ncbi:MAG: GNAT family N-acetyltransferase [Clostridiales bacterium]|nr:GNAT family N-acetyltransferase [Candidatus Coliplasma caballi]
MPDMLVRLYKLPDSKPIYEKLAAQNIRIIRPMTPNKEKVCGWIREHFSDGWANETATAFAHQPVSCFIAYDDNEKKILGFAGYDCTAKDFFGPTGVDETMRKKGIGGALLLRCLEAMRDEGYGYAIIGSAGPTGYYAKVCGAEIIENSVPGIYDQLI